MFSSVFILLACIITTLISPSNEGDPNYVCLIPLALLGIGYSVYAAALWGCIPYTVPARLVGTAYGLCTAVQNIGLTISPLIASACLETKKQDGYFWLMMYFSVLACIGIFFNVWLYFDDIRNRGGILDAIDDGSGQNNEALMSTPVAANKRDEAMRAMKASDDDAELEMMTDD